MSETPKPYDKASEWIDRGVGLEIRGTWWRVNPDGDLEKWSDNPAAELEKCRAALAEVHRVTGRGDGHGSPAETAGCIISACIDRQMEQTETIAALELCLAERDAWRAKFEDLEMHRASCCDQMEQERDAALRRVAELEAKGDRILFQHNAELRSQLARELKKNSDLRAEFVEVCEDFDKIRDRLDAVEKLVEDYDGFDCANNELLDDLKNIIKK